MKNIKRYTITAALPYANGPIHIGHLAGAYLPADIYARYLRLRGEDVLFVCGSDEHGVPVTLSAKQKGKKPQEIVDQNHAIIKQSFHDFGIAFDYYHRTSSELHHHVASEFFKKLYEDGIFVEKESEQYYDEENKQFLADRYITGECPKCSYANAYGDQCESCGSSLSPTELINPKSALSGNVPILKLTKHWYLPLDKIQDEWLEAWVDSHKKDWKSNVYGQCKSWLNDGLLPRAVTRDLDWGVPVPIDGVDGKVLYVWFDAPIGYISASQAWAKENKKDWRPYWQDEETKLVHFIGKDNIVFHCLIFPAMLKAHGDYILPENIPANEFMNLEGDKISTSRNHAVWLHEYLKDFPGKEDVLRYCLIANMPYAKDSEFTWKDFQAKNNNELVAVLGNFINRVIVLSNKYFKGIIPNGENIEDIKFKNICINLAKDCDKELEIYNARAALQIFMNIAREGNRYLTEHEPWKLAEGDSKIASTIYNCLQVCGLLNVYMQIFLPKSAKELSKMLNINVEDIVEEDLFNLLLSGNKINNATHLFDKIEDDVIALQIEKLKQAKEANDSKNKVMDEQITSTKAEITFDDFQKLDLRTATILTAEKVEKADKLLKFNVDLGFEQRTIVSGIAEHFNPEDLIGKKVTVVTNLAPRKIRGVESKGMILLAEGEDGNLIFVNSDTEIKNGAVIS